MVPSYSPDKSLWFNPNLEFLFNVEIVEYDMQSAGLSLIKKYGLLPETEIFRLENLQKGELNVAVGKLQRDRPGFSRELLDRFTETRADFLKANDLTDDRIVSVKKDAIFTVGQCNVTSFGKVQFNRKNHYSSYLRFAENANIEIYSGETELDVKGIGDISLARHRLYMLEFIRKMMSFLETKNPSTKRYLRNFVDNYKAMTLEEGYYLEFNNLSQQVNPIFNYRQVIVPLVQIALKEMEM